MDHVLPSRVALFVVSTLFTIPCNTNVNSSDRAVASDAPSSRSFDHFKTFSLTKKSCSISTIPSLPLTTSAPLTSF